MENATEQAIDLWEVNLALGKQIDDLICSIRLDRKNFSNIHDYLAVQLQDWDLIPKPATQFYTPTGAIALGISDSYEKLNQLDKALEWALIAFEARKNLMSASYPLQVGKIYYELGDLENAYHYFHLTYDLNRYSPFAGEDKKYWQFYKAEKERRRIKN